MDTRGTNINRPAGTEEPVVMPAKEARQGAETGRVRYVLLIGMALVIIGFAIVYMTAY